MLAEMDLNISVIYISLLDEGTPVFRPTLGVKLGDDLYEVLPTYDYDPEDENWEFKPGCVVRCALELHEEQKLLVAKELIRESGLS
jgi:hypothetical protein